MAVRRDVVEVEAAAVAHVGGSDAGIEARQ